ncbi:hypothetical protein HO173_001777 [Letharia columbiana]|uniref:BAH domain-containing protein n=1 Tax=Letharia columbiana TaxID=112416 RepID=A0A8H6G442_9LECA|nr:uncharacterized protein HO173_001777 [Letharia columbiana]KAF6240167.1 hypothetical protein HO173_001777 [Letharia columbiana]
MGLLPNVSSSTTYTIPITSTTFSEFASYKSKHSPAPSQTMSSDADMDSDPSTPPKSNNPPCMFTVEQFQLAASSQETDSEPSDVYIVRPTAIWDSLQRFKEVIIDDERYRMHDVVAAARHDLPNSPLWTAHVLEIRGHTPSGQVSIRVFWFHRPAQLPPSLRHPYQGRHELLASNAMAVIDATAVAGRTAVSHWREADEAVPAAGLFWRQTYDVQAQALSPLHTPCPPPCILHHNPDETLISCPSPGCDARMHESCILDATRSRLQADAEAEAGGKGKKKKKKKKKKKAKKGKGGPSLEVEVEWMDEPSEGYGAPVTEGPVEPGGRDGHFWLEEVYCLGCGGVMEVRVS